MGIWGAEPWENDVAADWFAHLFEDTGLAARVEETLRRDIWEWQEIRAAAYVLVQLGRTYIWPVDELHDHLKLAISRLEEILTEAVANGADEEWARAVIGEIDVLRSRLAQPTAET